MGQTHTPPFAFSDYASSIYREVAAGEARCDEHKGSLFVWGRRWGGDGTGEGGGSHWQRLLRTEPRLLDSEAGQPGTAGRVMDGGREGGREEKIKNQSGTRGPGAEEQAYDSLLYPLAIGGHFIQRILHADAHVLNGIELVHEALSLRVLQ